MIEIAMDLLVAWRQSRGARPLIVIIAVLVIVSAIALTIGRVVLYRPVADAITFGAGGLAGALALGTVAFVRSQRHEAQQEKIQAVERRAEEHPDEPKAAWDLARLKLESYLDRNLSQVRSIYWLTVLVMLSGFVLVAIGIWKVFEQPTANLTPSIVSAASGILVSLIGATLLTVYRATMAQARGYVRILERINAVGMSIQVLDAIADDAGRLRDETTASIAKQLLEMYARSPDADA